MSIVIANQITLDHGYNKQRSTNTFITQKDLFLEKLMNYQEFKQGLKEMTWEKVKNKSTDIVVFALEFAPFSGTTLATYNTITGKTINGFKLSKKARWLSLTSLPLSYVFTYSALAGSKEIIARTLNDWSLLSSSICDTLCQQERPTIGSPGITMSLAMGINTVIYGAAKRGHIKDILGVVGEKIGQAIDNTIEYVEPILNVDINNDGIIGEKV